MANIFAAPLDSLPYYDDDLEKMPQLRPQINSLIAVELRSILPKTASPSGPTNLTHLPAPRPLPTGPSLLASELQRVTSKKPLGPSEGLDTTRYAMPAPPEGSSLAAWEAAHDSSLAQLEHQRLRAINGTILAGPLGANSWKIQNFSLEGSVSGLERDGEEVRKVVEEVNRERKKRQEKGGEVLTRMERKWTELVSGNMQLEIGCMVLEQEVTALQARHAELKARLQAA